MNVLYVVTSADVLRTPGGSHFSCYIFSCAESLFVLAHLVARSRQFCILALPFRSVVFNPICSPTPDVISLQFCTPGDVGV
jgi:hypothetical protein